MQTEEANGTQQVVTKKGKANQVDKTNNDTPKILNTSL